MAEEQIKVLMLPKWYPNKFNPFNGNFIQNHIRAIALYCDPAVIFVHSDPGLTSTYRLQENTIEGVKEVRVYFRKPGSHFPFNKILWLIRFWKSYVKGYHFLLKNWGKPDISHVHVLTRPAVFAYYLKLVNRIPFFISEHWSGYLPERKAFKGAFKKDLTRLLSRKASCITAVSENLIKGMKTEGLKGKYKQIPNVVDTELFYPDKKGESNKKKRILHISTLSDYPKQVNKILSATAKLAKKRNDFELHIFGDGPEKSKQMELARSLSLIDRIVFFHGNVKAEILAGEMRKGAFLWLNSLFENQPCVILEAFASGLPVLSTEVGGIPEIVDKKKGILVEQGNEEMLLQGLNKMLDNYPEYDTKLLRQFIVKNYSPKAVGKKFYNLYRSIISE